ncbi:hypothetical protein WN48_05174 [Eufriesea mexicana]|uniref:Uncharacterized protein n=1 Tax=Eufriesea mexicana TaxID=516756 RepID=A0A310SHV8_9HYME|nr:hypothetical protein WN48_05174 [Eufriesea mexicana]
MKKRSNNENKGGKGRQSETNDEKNEKKNEISLNDEENQGFSEWLRSNDGLEMMRLFVIANSILIFFTMGLPKFQEVIGILKDYYYGEL